MLAVGWILSISHFCWPQFKKQDRLCPAQSSLSIPKAKQIEPAVVPCSGLNPAYPRPPKWNNNIPRRDDPVYQRHSCQAPGAPPSCSNICGANPVSIIGMNNCRVECPHPAFFHRALCITSKCFKPRAQKLYTNFRLLIKGMLKNGRTRGFITCIYAAAERCVWCSFQLQWNHIKSTFSSDTWWWNGLR